MKISSCFFYIEVWCVHIGTRIFSISCPFCKCNIILYIYFIIEMSVTLSLTLSLSLSLSYSRWIFSKFSYFDLVMCVTHAHTHISTTNIQIPPLNANASNCGVCMYTLKRASLASVIRKICIFIHKYIHCVSIHMRIR